MIVIIVVEERIDNLSFLFPITLITLEIKTNSFHGLNELQGTLGKLT